MAAYTLVTGASSGIGRAVAERLGASRPLILGGRNEERLNETLTAIGGGYGHKFWNCDLERLETISDSLAALLIDRQVEADSFVHCAGAVKLLPAKSMTVDAVRSVMAVNVLSAVEIVRVLLRKKINAGKLSNVVFISSIFSGRGARGNGIYAASKAALDAYMRSLALELAPEGRANSVAPGAVRTPMSAAAFDDPAFAERLKAEYPLGTGDVADVAAAVAFLLSTEARWITGQALVVDGGRSVQ